MGTPGVKACPKCGSTDHKVKRGPFTGDFCVECLACGFRGRWMDTEREAIDIWNTTTIHKFKHRETVDFGQAFTADIVEKKRGKG